MHVPLDTSDVERWIGRSIGGEQLREPVGLTDVRRWVQAMQNPNPAHFDEDFARSTRFGEVVVPQSFVIACSVRHGIIPAIQGTIPGSHQLNVGDDWWFAKNRIAVGDRITSVRQAIDFRTSVTKFAGPTVFQRGETTYLNQNSEVVARQRSTAMRYLVENLETRSAAGAQSDDAAWTDEQLSEFQERQLAYARKVRTSVSEGPEAINVGTHLSERLIGPHSIQSLTTEQRSYLYTVWGNLIEEGEVGTGRAFGGIEAMRTNADAAALDPGLADGLLHGGGRGHTDARYAGVIGMEKPFGYGASMTAYVVDYVSNWAGAQGLIRHSSLQYRSPVYVGDVTLIGATVADVEHAADSDAEVVTLDIRMSNQKGALLAAGSVVVEVAPTS